MELGRLGIEQPNTVTLTLGIDTDNKPRLTLDNFSNQGILRVLPVKKSPAHGYVPEGWIALSGAIVKEEPGMKVFHGRYLTRQEAEERGYAWEDGA